jgi:hypothetical protein
MLDSGMYLGIGLLAVGLSLLVVVPFVHDRAVRLTTRRVEDAQASRAEVLAEKDLQRAEFALAMRRLEVKLQEFRDKQACQLAELGRKSDVVNQLRMETDGLRDLLRKAEELVIAKTDEARELRRVAGQQGSELVETTDMVNQLRIETDGLRDLLHKAEELVIAKTNEARELQRVAGQKGSELAETTIALEAARWQLTEEQTTSVNFRDRIAAFMREIAMQINEEKERDLRLQQDLQRRLFAQSRLLSDSESARNQLFRQLEITRDAAQTMQIEVVEAERRVVAEVEGLKRENNRLHGTLHRAHGERVRLAYELAKTQAKGSQAA